jgi:Zn-dependent M28 family amino/carboxypeptidase
VKGKNEHGFNVLGWKAGSTAEYVVVGAHYDHIGMGKRFSMEPGDRGKIHPGADDNASGVAAMLELARLVAQGPVRRRGVLFVAFGGEEHGLFGSSALLQQLPAGFGRLTGMINFDMVGRLRERELFVAGLASVPELEPVAEAAAAGAGLRLERITDYPYNMSDHGNFLEAGIPAVLLFTGLHLEYHTAKDTADRVNAEGAALILDVAYELLVGLAESAEAPRYLPGKDPAYERNLRELATPPNPFQQE